MPIEPCTCENEYQDKMYGKGMRVKNTTGSGGSRCTVCGAGGGGGKKYAAVTEKSITDKK